ncbi:MAG: anti-sigma factor domain-containing protein [Acidimicrobiales bacterium]
MTPHLDHAEIEALLGAYALDAVEDDERAVVGAHLSVCARCRGEVEVHREVAALLAHSGAPAPEGLWSRIAEALDDAPPALSLARAPVSPARPPAGGRGRRSWGARVVAVVMTAAAAVIAVLAVQVRNQDRRVDELSELLATDGVSSAFQSALADPDARLVQLASADQELKIKALVTADGRGFVSAAPLPPLAEGRTYQLWADLGERQVSLGLLGPDPDVVAFKAFPGVLGLALTDEAAPGVVVSERPAVVSGALPG